MKLIAGKKYDVTPIEFKEFGVIVKLKDDTTSLIHISQISDDYVDNIENFVDLDTAYTALCINCNDRLQLSLKYLNIHSKKQKKSLDEMIEKANKDFLDKYRNMKSNKFRYRQK